MSAPGNSPFSARPHHATDTATRRTGPPISVFVAVSKLLIKHGQETISQDQYNALVLGLSAFDWSGYVAPADDDEEHGVLAELVAVKDLKDKQGKTAEYERRQPLAWQAARKALGGS